LRLQLRLFICARERGPLSLLACSAMNCGLDKAIQPMSAFETMIQPWRLGRTQPWYPLPQTPSCWISRACIYFEPGTGSMTGSSTQEFVLNLEFGSLPKTRDACGGAWGWWQQQSDFDPLCENKVLPRPLIEIRGKFRGFGFQWPLIPCNSSLCLLPETVRTKCCYCWWGARWFPRVSLRRWVLRWRPRRGAVEKYPFRGFICSLRVLLIVAQHWIEVMHWHLGD